MKIHDVVQGSPDWLRVRMGKPTASNFHILLTTTGKISKAQGVTDYRNFLLAEMLTGSPIIKKESEWMEHGKEVEPEAAEAYELVKDCRVQTVGFVTNDAETIGCSPDRLVGDDGLLQIKCPAPWTHVGYMMGDELTTKYKAQVQGELLIAEREWCDVMSYHQQMPTAIYRVGRDEEFIAMLSEALNAFVEDMQRSIEALTERYGPKVIAAHKTKKKRLPSGETAYDIYGGLHEEDLKV